MEKKKISSKSFEKLDNLDFLKNKKYYFIKN